MLVFVPTPAMFFFMKKSLLALALTLLIPAFACIAQEYAAHASHDATNTTAMSPRAQEMSRPGTGDADADFIRGMIPHHEGAIMMADEVLKNGRDPEVKMLAQDIIRAQQDEIKWMKEWLAKKGIPEKGAYTAK